MDSLSISGIIGFIMGFGFMFVLVLYQWRKGKGVVMMNAMKLFIQHDLLHGRYGVTIFILLLGSVVMRTELASIYYCL